MRRSPELDFATFRSRGLRRRIFHRNHRPMMQATAKRLEISYGQEPLLGHCENGARVANHERLDFLCRNSGPHEQGKKLNKKKVVRAKVSSTRFTDVIPPGVLRKQYAAEISRLLHPYHQFYVLLRPGRRYAIEF